MGKSLPSGRATGRYGRRPGTTMNEHSSDAQAQFENQLCAPADARAREMVNTLLTHSTNPALEGARAEAIRVELVCIKNIEAAMVARQDCSQVKTILEKARADQAAAEAQARQTEQAAEKAIKRATDTAAAAEKAKVDAAKAVERVATTAENAINAVSASEAATEAAETAQQEVYKLSGEWEKLQQAVHEEELNLKNARRIAERMAARAEECKKLEQSSLATIVKAEAASASKVQAAREASKKASQLREEADEALKAYESAAHAAMEFEGQGGVWEERSQKTLKQRKQEHERAAAAAQKATQDETAAEAASEDSIDKVKHSHEDAATKATQAVEAAEASTQAADKLLIAMSDMDDLTKTESAAKVAYDAAMKALKQAQTRAEQVTVQRAEMEAADAKVEEVAAAEHETKTAAAAIEAQSVMERAVGQRDAAAAAVIEKMEVTAKAAERETEAEAKELVVAASLADLDAKVQALSIAAYEARMGAPPWWTMEDSVAKASASSEARRLAAARDAKGIAGAKDRTRNGQLTVLDKWRCFREWTDDGTCDSELWNVRRVLYAIDGAPLSGLPILVADILGSALDRGSPSAKNCKVHGAGLAQASVNQTATFEIISFSQHGIRFEDGGDEFVVEIRFAGLGRQRTLAKIADNDDGSYAVSYRPPCAGKCTIRVALAGQNGASSDELPGSPFKCVVAGMLGPPPVASRCTVQGDALFKVVAQSPEQFAISFRDAFGQVAHACELDVWVTPTHTSIEQLKAIGATIGGSGSPTEQQQPTGDGGDAAEAESSTALAPDVAAASSSANTLAALSSSPTAVLPDWAAESDLPSEVARLLTPLGAFESLVVGNRPVDVTRTPDANSVRIGRMQAGRALKVARIEPPTESGALRACVRLELEDLEPKDSSTWRRHWVSHQPWRSLSWRAHQLAEARQEAELEEAAAYVLAVQRREVETGAAMTIQTLYRGLLGRQKTQRILREKEEAIVAAERAARLAEEKANAKKGGMSSFAGRKRGTPSKGGAKEGGAKEGDGEGGGEGEAPKTPAKEAKEAATPAGKGGAKTPAAASSPNKKGAARGEGETPKPEAKADATTEGSFTTPKAEAKAEANADTKTEAKPEAKAADTTKADTKADATADAKAAKGEPKGDEEAAAATKPEGGKGKKKGKADGKDKEAKGAADAKGDATKAATKGSKSGRQSSPEKGKGKGKAAAAESKASKGSADDAAATNATTADGPASAAAEAAPPTDEAKAATVVQAAARGVVARKQAKAAKAERAAATASAPTAAEAAAQTAPASAPAAAAAASPSPAAAAAAAPKAKRSTKQAGKGKASARPPPPEPSPIDVAASAALSQQRAHAGPSPDGSGGPLASADRSVVSGSGSARLSMMSSPRRLISLNLRGQASELYGWVTLAAGGKSLVTRQTARLPAHVRQQHQQHWNRRAAIDSERERERAIQRDSVTEASVLQALSPRVRASSSSARATPAPRVMGRTQSFGRPPPVSTGRQHSPPGTKRDQSKTLSPRPAYWTDIEADPNGMGFAYGGVYPGRLHAKGKLLESHDVQFSIGVCGTYLLYVSLRQPHTLPNPGTDQLPEDGQVAGSPFLLRVVPGNAYALSTEIPRGSQQLRGGREPGERERFSCEYILTTRDKMSNLCDTGGAKVECGFLDAMLPPSPGQQQTQAGGEADKVEQRHGSSCVDQGDGTYKLQWYADRPGAFTVFVKIDGLHVLGSPTRMVLASSAT